MIFKAFFNVTFSVFLLTDIIPICDDCISQFFLPALCLVVQLMQTNIPWSRRITLYSLFINICLDIVIPADIKAVAKWKFIFCFNGLISANQCMILSLNLFSDFWNFVYSLEITIHTTPIRRDKVEFLFIQLLDLIQ